MTRKRICNPAGLAPKPRTGYIPKPGQTECSPGSRGQVLDVARCVSLRRDRSVEVLVSDAG